VKRTLRTAFVLSPYTISDPTTRNTIFSLKPYFQKVIVVQQNSATGYSRLTEPGVEVYNVDDYPKLKPLFGFKSVLKWITYKRELARLLTEYDPELIVTFMLHPLAALPRKYFPRVISCIYDIPDMQKSGRLDKRIFSAGFSKLNDARLVWASDEYKAALTKQMANLRRDPVVCYNCPPLNYAAIDKSMCRRWLRNQLKQEGTRITENSGSVLIRAGAVGPFGGIEETIAALTNLPDDFVFLMMGRPDREYEMKIRGLIEEHSLQHQAILWSRPDDDTWKKAIFGSDIGHLIHVKPSAESGLRGSFELNSSLSNYRLFYYMAAALPILSYHDPRLENLHKRYDCFTEIDMTHGAAEIESGWKKLATESLAGSTNSGSIAFSEVFNWEKQFEPIHEFIVSMLKLEKNTAGKTIESNV
jgi:hypothetical protein